MIETVRDMDKYLVTILVLFLGISTRVSIVECFSNGPPSAACPTLSPNRAAHGARPQTTPVPYAVNLSALADPNGGFSYEPGRTYMLSFAGSGSQQQEFQGVFLQGRSVADGTTPAGTFTVSDPLTQLSSCSPPEIGVVHNSNQDKLSISTIWTAPAAGSGPVHIGFSVVRTREVYWADVQTEVINERVVSLDVLAALATLNGVECWLQARSFRMDGVTPANDTVITVNQSLSCGGIYRITVQTSQAQTTTNGLASNAVCLPVVCSNVSQNFLRAVSIDNGMPLSPVAFDSTVFNTNETETTPVILSNNLFTFQDVVVTATPTRALPFYPDRASCEAQGREDNQAAIPADFFKFNEPGSFQSSTPTPQSTATTPQSTATTPQSTATTQQSTVTTPQSTVTTPQSTATTPQSTATTPQSTATTPQSTATTPQSTATTPQSTATTPQSTATTPKTTIQASETTPARSSTTIISCIVSFLLAALLTTALFLS